MRIANRIWALGLVLALAGCSGAPSAPNAGSLYEDLGGQPGIDRFVSATVAHAAEDRMIGHLFAESDLAETSRLLAEQICELSGGPCRYSGRSMEEAHSGMDISTGEFNRLVELLQHAMRAESVPISAENRLIAVLARLHGQVVGQ